MGRIQRCERFPASNKAFRWTHSSRNSRFGLISVPPTDKPHFGARPLRRVAALQSRYSALCWRPLVQHITELVPTRSPLKIHLIPWLKRVSEEIGLGYSAVSIRATDPMGQLFCAPFDQSQRTAFVFAAGAGYLCAGARAVSHEAFKPFTQILAISRVLPTRLSTIGSATAQRQSMDTRMADGV